MSGADEYLANAVAVPEPFIDPVNPAKCNYTPKTKITIAWNEGASTEEKLERIITQKWIANFPLGFEGWADYRRTGYPEVFPSVSNLSNGVIDTNRQLRRLPFPCPKNREIQPMFRLPFQCWVVRIPELPIFGGLKRIDV